MPEPTNPSTSITRLELGPDPDHPGFSELAPREDGRFVLFTEHEAITAEFEKEREQLEEKRDELDEQATFWRGRAEEAAADLGEARKERDAEQRRAANHLLRLQALTSNLRAEIERLDNEGAHISTEDVRERFSAMLDQGVSGEQLRPECERCGGKGEVFVPPPEGYIECDVFAPCPDCNGTGKEPLAPGFHPDHALPCPNSTQPNTTTLRPLEVGEDGPAIKKPGGGYTTFGLYYSSLNWAVEWIEKCKEVPSREDECDDWVEFAVAQGLVQLGSPAFYAARSSAAPELQEEDRGGGEARG